MAEYGYARAARTGPTNASQRERLAGHGVETVYEDGPTTDGLPALAEMLGRATSGDRVTVVSLDRLGRSVPAVLQAAEQLRASGAALRSLDEHFDFGTEQGETVARVIGALAESERTLANERAATARAALRKPRAGTGLPRGRSGGRKRIFGEAQVREAQVLLNEGKTIGEICQILGASRATLHRLGVRATASPESPPE